MKSCKHCYKPLENCEFVDPYNQENSIPGLYCYNCEWELPQDELE